LNKVVFKTYGYSYPTFLTGIHFVFTFLGLVACARLGMFEVKVVPFRQVLPLSLTFTGFVVFNNLSLQFNSLGFYQLMKVMTTPAVVLIQLIGFGVKIHPKLGFSLIPICVGVVMATVNDFDLNFWGMFWAICGIISTSFYQIWVKSKQQDLGLNSFQLLFLQAPPSAALVGMLSLVSEPWTGPDGLLNYPYDVYSLSAIIGTGVMSFCVNLSIFLVIGQTSPIAYNVLGHFKLICILMSGFLFFGESSNAPKTIGTILTLAGVIIYTHYQQTLKSGWEEREKHAKAQATHGKYQPLTNIQMDDELDDDDEEHGLENEEIERTENGDTIHTISMASKA